MRKELIGIFLCFLVVLTVVSFSSYDHTDPSVHHSISKENIEIHNLFGRLGAHLSGFFIGLIGLGAWFIPFLLFKSSIHFFAKHPPKKFLHTLSGGILLILSTGGLLSLYKDYYVLLGSKFSSGGIICISLKSFLIKYTNYTGTILIFTLMLWAGITLTTGISLTKVSKKMAKLSFIIMISFWKTFLVYFKEEKEILNQIHQEQKNLPAAENETTPSTSKARKKKKSKNIPKEKATASEEIKHAINTKKPPENKSKEPLEEPSAKEPEIKIKTPKPKKTDSKDEFVPNPNVLKTKYKDEGFQLPPASFLDEPQDNTSPVNKENLRMLSGVLEGKLEDFGIKGNVVEISPGPVITTFEYKPAPGVKISKIVNLADDLKLALSALSIRIVAPIPGKDVIGIEIPNDTKEIVLLKEIITSSSFKQSKSKLTLCLGKDIVGNPVAASMDKMPHLLIAGATGTGKSVGLNAMITSILYKATPDEVKLIMIDPKRIELSAYDGIPHLISPVVTDMKKATNALFWAVKEMERRYEILANKKVRNISQYNSKIKKETPAEGEEPAEKLPYIIIIIDELADLMMVSSKDVEVALTRLAQMARAAGLHIILATQRPSVDVLTGIIKANFPTRMSFQVSSRTDSRTIIDSNGAENLLGNGDMLYLPPGTAKLQRIHGAYISEDELTKITDFLKDQKEPEYVEDVTETAVAAKTNTDEKEYDVKYDEAVALVTKTKQASISMVQRHLRIGYNRAARIIEIMEQDGVVGPSDGVKPRKVLVKGYEEIP